MTTLLHALNPCVPARAGLMAAALLLIPAPARAALDCDKLKTTKEPFALVTKQGDKSVAMQVFREGDGIATALVAVGDVVAKQRYDYGQLVFSRRTSPKENLRLKVESTAKGDMFGKKQSFAYDEKIATSGVEGVPAFDMRFSTKADFKGEEDLTIGACTFKVLHYATTTKTSDSTLQAGETGGDKHSQMTVNDKFYSPALQMVVAYKTQIVVDGKVVSGTSFNPNAIETDFTPIKDPGD